MLPVGESYLGISGYVVFWVLFAIVLFFFNQRGYLLIRLMLLGRKENRFDSLFYRIIYMLALTFSQWCSLKSVTRKDTAGIGHAFIFSGFGLFAIGYSISISLGAGFGLSTLLTGSASERVYSPILDIVALLIIVSVSWAVVKRYIIKLKYWSLHAHTV
jgi:hypothetical protein